MLTPAFVFDSTDVIGNSMLQFGFVSRFRRCGWYKFDSYGFGLRCSVFFSKICTFGQSGEQFTWTLQTFSNVTELLIFVRIGFCLLLIFQVHDEENDWSMVGWRCFVIQNATILVRIQIRIHCIRHRFVQRKAKLFEREHRIIELILCTYTQYVALYLQLLFHGHSLLGSYGILHLARRAHKSQTCLGQCICDSHPVA